MEQHLNRFVAVADHVPFPGDLAAQRMLESLLRDAVREAHTTTKMQTASVYFAGYRVSSLDASVGLSYRPE